jgi:4-amino-4-deoxy-L-arabinose transferase-like glycosyltransferase
MDRDEIGGCAVTGNKLTTKTKNYLLTRIERLSMFESPSVTDWLVYFAAFILIQAPAILNFYSNHGLANPYLLFADSLLKGQLVLPHSVNPSDLIFFNNNYYLPYPPLPSVVLLPFVAIFGVTHVNTVAIATVMACISLYLMYKILVRLGIEQGYLNWIMLAVFFGTGYWFAIFTSHHVYAFAQITSFLFELLVIYELTGRRRWWLVGIYIGCAFLSRQLTVFYFVFAAGYMYFEMKQKREAATLRDFIALCSTLGAFVLLDLLYNYLRFGNPLDTGYGHIVYIGVLKERVQEYGPFSVRYVLFNLYSVFVKGFNIEFGGKAYMHIKDMDLWGTSLLSASPFLIASAKATWPKILKISAWVTIAIILTGQLFYHNNGFHQINTTRFTLDFLPLVIVLTALGARHLPKWLFRGMVVYAMLLNIIGFVIHFLFQK